MTITHLITADELEAMGSDARFELIQGVLHEMSPSSTDTSALTLYLGGLLSLHVVRNKLGKATGADGGYLLELNPDSVVLPDVGFISKERISLQVRNTGIFPSRPDLAIEVISPTDEPLEFRRKQALYERAVVPWSWWIDPRRRTATVHVPGQPVKHLTEADMLDAGEVVPGFSVSLAELFDL